MDFLPGSRLHSESSKVHRDLSEGPWIYTPHNRGEREDVFLDHCPFRTGSIFCLSSGYFSSVLFPRILPASRQRPCTQLTSRACVSLLFQYHCGIRPTASHHYNRESNICRQFTATIWPDNIISTLTRRKPTLKTITKHYFTMTVKKLLSWKIVNRLV